MQNERRNKSFPFSFVGTPRSPAKSAVNIPSPAVTVLRNPSFIFPDYHSGVSLIFTGIAVNTITGIDPSLAAIISGTIVSAAIINEIIAVLLAKAAFRRAGEIDPQQTQKPHPTA